MEFTAKQIADFIGGRVEGNEQTAVHTFAKIEEGKEGAITFLSNPKYTSYIYETKASIVLINEDVELEHPVNTTLIRVKNAYECVAKLLQLYEPPHCPRRRASTHWRSFLHRQRLAKTFISVPSPSSEKVSRLAMAHVSTHMSPSTTVAR